MKTKKTATRVVKRRRSARKSMSGGAKRRSARKSAPKKSAHKSKASKKSKASAKKSAPKRLRRSARKSQKGGEMVKSKGKKAKRSNGDKPKRTLHPSLVEFAKLRKFVAEKIGKDGKPAMILASVLKKEAQKKNPDGSMAELVAEAKKIYSANPNKYRPE